MKFKVLPGSPLFDKLDKLRARIKEVNKIALALAQECGAKTFHPAHAYGGGITAMWFKEKPAGWKNVKNTPNAFMPYHNKKFRSLWEKINALPVVSFQELNKIVKFKGMQFLDYNDKGGIRIIYGPGFFTDDKIFLLRVPEGAEYKPVKGMIEITDSEYHRLYQAGKAKKPKKKNG